MSAITLELPNFSYAKEFSRDKLLSSYPDSMIATTLEVTGESSIPMTMPFLTPHVLDILHSIVEHKIVPRVDPSQSANLIKAGDYLNIGLLSIIGDPKYQRITKGEPNLGLLDPWILEQAIALNFDSLQLWVIQGPSYEHIPSHVRYRALSFAMIRGHTKIVQAIMDRIDGNFNMSQVQSDYGIGYACRFGHVEIVKALLPHVSDLGYQNNVLIRQACRYGRKCIVELIIDHPQVDPTVMHNICLRRAVRYGHMEVVQLLLEKKEVNPADYYNEAVERACMQGRNDIVRLLLRDPRVQPTDRCIRWSSCRGYTEITRMLLTTRRDCFTPDALRRSLRSARLGNYPEIETMLLTE